MVNLLVNFSSQWDSDANEDASDNCGPTCIKMILNYFGENVTTNEIFEKTGAGKGNLINISQMITAINSFGYRSAYLTNQTVDQLTSYLDKNIPIISLVHYGNLTSRQDLKYSGGHFMTMVGYRSDGYFVNDPDFWGSYRTQGDHHFYTKTDFETGWTNANLDYNPKNSLIIIYPQPKPVIVSTPPIPETSTTPTQTTTIPQIPVINTPETGTTTPTVQTTPQNTPSEVLATNNQSITAGPSPLTQLAAWFIGILFKIANYVKKGK